MAEHNVVGRVGEDIATKWLLDHGYEVLERNYLKKWGEIDIIARETNGKVHFVEVKSVSYETNDEIDVAVTHETYRPEDRVDRNKQERLKRAIQSWIIENKYKGEFQIDILVVYLVPREKYAQVKLLRNVIFD
jgi:putative endonuclease